VGPSGICSWDVVAERGAVGGQGFQPALEVLQGGGREPGAHLAGVAEPVRIRDGEQQRPDRVGTAALPGPPAGDQVATKILCANVYPNGDEIVRMDERMVRLEARKGVPDTIAVTVEGEPPTVFLRCEE
jgi:hypothetical protein